MEDLKDLADILSQLTDDQKSELETKHGVKIQTSTDPLPPDPTHPPQH